MPECAFKTRLRVPCQFESIDPSFPGAGRAIVDDNGTQLAFCEFHLPWEYKREWSAADKKRLVERMVESLESSSATGRVDFHGVVVPAPLEWSGQCRSHINFASAKFWSTIEFRESDFPRGLNLPFVHFYGRADFSGTTFGGMFNCRHSKFHDSATFSGCRFVGYPSSEQSDRRASADFLGVEFFRLAEFLGCEFHSCRFADAKFRGVASFSQMTLTTRGLFDSATFEDVAKFDHARFKGSSRFNNAVFRNEATFAKAEFADPPRFHGAKIHQGTSFAGAVFLEAKADADVEARAYRTLKLSMESVRARQEEARFYALEQGALRRNPETPLWARNASRFYDLSSKYGQDALRPLALLAWTMLAFSLVYWLTKQMVAGPKTGEVIGLILRDLGTSVYFSVEQVVRPFSLWTPQGESAAHSFLGSQAGVVVMQCFGLVQSTLSGALLALFALAIRWRFRRG